VFADLSRRAGFHVEWEAIDKDQFLEALTRELLEPGKMLDELVLLYSREVVLYRSTRQPRDSVSTSSVTKLPRLPAPMSEGKPQKFPASPLSHPFAKSSRSTCAVARIVMRIEHLLPPELVSSQSVRILVVGAGGTGSAIAMGLPYLDHAMRIWGHPMGLEVAMMDADVVTETNCIRQPFSTSDIGQNKATVLINRLNLFWGTTWSAIPNHFHAKSFERSHDRSFDLLIGCVDTRAGRKAIEESFTKSLRATCYWLDLGNNAASGQYVLGQPLNARNRRKAERLRTVSELYPEIIDTDAGEDPLPSCSAVEALDRQEPFINQTLASSALAMLAQLFRYGKLTHHGAFFNAKTGQMSALPVDPKLWSKTRKRSRQSQRTFVKM